MDLSICEFPKTTLANSKRFGVKFIPEEAISLFVASTFSSPTKVSPLTILFEWIKCGWTANLLSNECFKHNPLSAIEEKLLLIPQ